jgi:CheY-like chemotaxis protein
MARPKKPTDELKDQRVPIMMSEDELKAIDDWRFECRIGSRGDAIRRLCRMALVADDDWPVIWRRILSVKEMGSRAIDRLAEHEPDADWALRVKADMMDLQMEGLELNAQLTQIRAGDTAVKAFAGARLAKEQLRADLLDEKALYALEFGNSQEAKDGKD